MGTLTNKPRKHIPQRTCVGCREVQGKKTMIRLVRTSDGVILDPTGKSPGRGAYLHLQQECITKGIHGTIARALKTELSKENLNQLDEILRNQLSSLQNLQTEQISTIQN